MHKGVHSSFDDNGSKLEIIKMFTRTDKLSHIFTVEHYKVKKKDELIQHGWNHRERSEKEEHLLYDFISLKFKNRQN